MQVCEYCGEKMHTLVLMHHFVHCINNNIEDPIKKLNEYSNLNWYYIYDNTRHPPYEFFHIAS